MGIQAGTTVTTRRTTALADAIARRREAMTVRLPRQWRQDDPPATTVGELSPEDIGGRVVIRSGEFLGTVYGTLLGVFPHPSLTHFTCVQLYAKRLLTFRDDMEVIVVDDLRPRVAERTRG